MVSVDSHAMLAACGIDMPKDLPRLTVDDHMNGSKDLEDKKRVLRMASTELREKFFPGSTAFWEDFYKKVELDYTYDADYDLNRFDSNGLPFFDDAKPFEALQPF